MTQLAVPVDEMFAVGIREAASHIEISSTTFEENLTRTHPGEVELPGLGQSHQFREITGWSGSVQVFQNSLVRTGSRQAADLFVFRVLDWGISRDLEVLSVRFHGTARGLHIAYLVLRETMIEGRSC